MSMLGFSLERFDAERPGPYYSSGTAPHRFTAGAAKILSKVGIRSQIVSVLVDTKDANTTLNIYEGTNSSGTLIASIKLSKLGTIPMFLKVSGGLYVSCMGGAGSAIIVLDAATYNSGLLTLSGNEITDATRSAATQWATNQSGGSVDQFSPPDSSYGVWEAGTNLFPRGQNDATGSYTSVVNGGVAAVIAIDATVPAPFSPQSIKVTVDGGGTQQGTQPQTNTGQAIATGVLCCGSIWMKGTAGQSYRCLIVITNTDASTTSGTVTTFNATGAWQIVVPAALAVAAAKTGDRVNIRIQTSSARAESFWVAHPMLQGGTGVVSPYVATSGGTTATRAVARVQAPATVLNATQGWVALRVRMPYASTAVPIHGGANTAYLMFWQDSGSNGIGLRLDSTVVLTLQRDTTGSGAAASGPTISWSAGDVVTFIGKWDAATGAVSFNGAAFSSTANTQTATPAGASFDIGTGGSGAANKEVDADILWAACGTGTLTDADAATINGFGSTDKLVSDFPGNCTFFWPADTSRYYTP